MLEPPVWEHREKPLSGSLFWPASCLPASHHARLLSSSPTALRDSDTPALAHLERPLSCALASLHRTKCILKTKELEKQPASSPHPSAPETVPLFSPWLASSTHSLCLSLAGCCCFRSVLNLGGHGEGAAWEPPGLHIPYTFGEVHPGFSWKLPQDEPGSCGPACALLSWLGWHLL